jgi:23S rRNA (adenine2503-C2)-methyltransferase
MHKIDLKSLSRAEVEAFFLGRGHKIFRAKQFLHWLYEKHVESIDQITEFSLKSRTELNELATISNLTLLNRLISSDGTEKFLWRLNDGESIECVLIPEVERLTLCISSQVGCALGCKFCLTGSFGFTRNLTSAEIVDQIISVSRLCGPKKITNVVLMGMGEPLANLENVTEALWRMTDLMKISHNKITLSTAGVLPALKKFPAMSPPIKLAVSLSATTNEIRDQIMPVNRTYPLKELLDACRVYPLKPRGRITFEYVVLKGINDSPQDARRLLRILKGIPAMINLIPFNPYSGAAFQAPDEEDLQVFQNILAESRMTSIIRKSKGADILAACGQLKANRTTAQD